MSIECSFCGYVHRKSDDFTRKIICGPKAAICAVCVMLCKEISIDGLSPDQQELLSDELKKQQEGNDAITKKIIAEKLGCTDFEIYVSAKE